MKKKNRLKKEKKTDTLSEVKLMTTRLQKLHITSRLISAYLLHCSQTPINTLFYQFNSLFANTKMYKAINKLRYNRIIYANFIHEYGVNFHELYFKHLLFAFINLTQVHNFTVSEQDIFTFRRLSVFTVSFTGILQVLMR